MSRKHILFGLLLLLITLVHQIAAEEKVTTSENPDTLLGVTVNNHTDKAIQEMDYDYLAKEEKMFEKYFYLFNS